MKVSLEWDQPKLENRLENDLCYISASAGMSEEAKTDNVLGGTNESEAIINFQP